MRNYIIKRIAQSVLILFCVMFIIYALIRSLPSSFAETMAMQLAQAPGAKPYEEWLAQLNAAYGLDLDIIPGFFTWLSKAVVGNFGDSWKWNVPATQKFTEVIGLSVIMGGISFVLSIVIAVPLGVLAATKQYSKTDYVISVLALAGISLPTFFFASLLKLVFSVSSCMVMLIIETSCSKLRWMLELMLKKRAFVKAFSPLTVSSEAYMDMENRAASIMMEKISVIFQLSFMEHSPLL